MRKTCKEEEEITATTATTITVMKDTLRKEYHRKTRKLLETNLEVCLVRFTGQFLKGTKGKLKSMAHRTSKLMAIYKALLQ